MYSIQIRLILYEMMKLDDVYPDEIMEKSKMAVKVTVMKMEDDYIIQWRFYRKDFFRRYEYKQEQNGDTV